MTELVIIKKPNENPFRPGTKKQIAWRVVRGYGGCSEEECISALDAAGLARHGKDQMGNRGYLREFHRLGLVELADYKYQARKKKSS